MKSHVSFLALGLSALAVFSPAVLNAEVHTVGALSDHAGVGSALQVRPGDTITLPALGEGRYSVLNNRIARLEQDGTTVTILTPGILGIEQLNADGSASLGVAAVLSLPDPIANGRIFVRNPNHWDASNWANPEIWKQPGVASNSDYPHLPDDIAILPQYGDWSYEVNLPASVSLGGLMIGAYKLDRDMYFYRYTLRGQEGGGSTLAFSRTDGQNAWIQFCPNGTDVNGSFYSLHPVFGDTARPLTMSCLSDVDVDLGWDGVNSYRNIVRVEWRQGCTLDVPAEKTLTFWNGSPRQESGYYWVVGSENTPAAILTGAGTIANRAGTSFLFDFNASAFSGTVIEAAKGREDYERNGNTWFSHSDTVGNTALEIFGYVVRSDYRSYNPQDAAGYVRIGSNHTWPGQMDIGNRLPGREVVLHGGKLELLPEQTVWENPTAKLLYQTGRLVVTNGFTHLTAQGPDEGTFFPGMLFSAANVFHDNKATVSLACNRLWATSYSFRAETYFPWFADNAVGGIVPWLAAYMDQPSWGSAGGWESLGFPVAENGYLRNPGLESTSLADAADNANVTCNGKDLTLTADKTINSLVLANPYGGGKKIGEGRTLTITSGGLVLNNKTGIGENDWNQTVPAAACGTLAFGATAYVFSNNHQDGNNQSWIMSKMIAPYGFVNAHAGNLAIAGDQTGIDDEIVVNAGRLALGIDFNMNGVNHDMPCLIDVPVRVLAGATLAIANVTGTTLDRDQNVYLDDVGGFPAKISIPEGKTETCLTLYARNSIDSVEWTSLERGTYGATGSGAEHIDDAHFTGLGVLAVRRDDFVQPTMLMIW